MGYQKHWPNGSTQEIPIRCYSTGAERIEKLSWLKPDEVVIVSGEITDKGAVYAHQIQQLSTPERVPDAEDDAYLSGMQRSSKG